MLNAPINLHFPPPGRPDADASPTGEAGPLPRRRETQAPYPPCRMLLIDDEPSFVRALARLLRHDGHTVDTAANGDLALTYVHAQRYDVVLCDLRMPGLDGPTFYARLCAQYPALRQRVLFLTGDALDADSQAFLAQCGQSWVTKPCAAATIRSAIQQLLHAVESTG
jgi:CheY-like chemotaxis protein